jgi:hypothetical protein
MDVYAVPVPERFMPLVYRVLADAYEEEHATQAGVLEPSVSPPQGGGSAKEWTKEEVMRAYRRGTPALRAALRYLAAHATNEVRSRDLARAVYPNLSSDEAESKLYGVLGAFGRQSSSIYGKQQKKWYFDRYRERVNGKLSYFVYKMQSREAAWVKEASEGE